MAAGRSNRNVFLEQILKKYPQEELVLTFGSRTFGKYSAVQLGTIVRARYPQGEISFFSCEWRSGFCPFARNVDDNYLYRYLVDSLWQEGKLSSPCQAIFQENKGVGETVRMTILSHKFTEISIPESSFLSPAQYEQLLRGASSSESRSAALEGAAYNPNHEFN